MVIHFLANFITFSSNIIFQILDLLYIVSGSIGSFIVYLLLSLSLSLFYAAKCLLSVVSVLSEDFIYFIKDILSLLQEIVESINKSYDLLLMPCRNSDKTKEFLNSVISGKFITNRMEQGVSIVKRTGEAFLTLLVFIWESTSFFVYILQCLNKAPFLIVMYIARKLDSVLYAIQDFFFSTFQTTALLLLNVGLLLLLYKFNIHIFVISLINRVKKYFWTTVITEVNAKFVLILKLLLLSYCNLCGKTREVFSKTCGHMYSFCGKLCKELISKTPTKAALKIQLEQEKLERLCVVCLDAKRNTMLLNCRHLILCMRCAQQIFTETRECPICRSYILDVLNVYI